MLKFLTLEPDKFISNQEKQNKYIIKDNVKALQKKNNKIVLLKYIKI